MTEAEAGAKVERFERGVLPHEERLRKKSLSHGKSTLTRRRASGRAEPRRPGLRASEVPVGGGKALQLLRHEIKPPGHLPHRVTLIFGVLGPHSLRYVQPQRQA